MRPGDLIVELAGAPVRDVADVQRALPPSSIGEAIQVKLVREDRDIELQVVPAELARAGS
jgi:S1-C subfamily serine protease